MFAVPCAAVACQAPPPDHAGQANAPDLAVNHVAPTSAIPDLGARHLAPTSASHGPEARTRRGAHATLEVHWDLLTALHQTGSVDNGFSLRCDSPGARVKTLQFTARSSSGASATTAVPCPAGAAGGRVALILPPPPGPFTVSAVAVGKPQSRSEKIHNVTERDQVTLRIYLRGCDQAACR
jgi:hypothetical protein